MSSGAFYARMKFIGLLNVLFHTAVYMLLYVGTDSLRKSIAIGSGIFGVFGIANHYVWLFRGTPIGIEDITSIRTAAGVAGNYDYTPDRYIILLGLLLLLWSVTLYRLGGDEYCLGRRVHFKQGMALASVALFACLPFVGYGDYYKDNSNAFNYDLYFAGTLATLCQKSGMEIPEYYSAKAVETIANESAAARAEREEFNYDLYFAGTLATLCQKSGMEIPEYYSAKAVETIANESAAARAEREEGTADGVQPNIIAIMSESYGDLRVLGDFETNIPVTPFMDSLKEDDNTISGYAYASIFGSKTANSEFEFLSSDSILYIPDTMVYLHYFDNVTAYDSLVSVLKNQGYTTSAMHPYLRAGWNRPAVYSKMGFDETMFLEDMTDVGYYRQYPSDAYTTSAMHPYLRAGWNRPAVYSKMGFDETMFLEDMTDVGYYRQYPSDAYNFELIQKRFENKAEGEKLFLFDITMQNHGGYEGEGNGYEQTVSIVGHAEPRRL